MPASHAKQKKALKHKKKRDTARLKDRETTRLSLRSSDRELLRVAAGRPLGPAFITEDWEFGDPVEPELISVIVTRWAPGKVLLGAHALIDRTCLGVKNAMLLAPHTERQMEERVAWLGDQIGSLCRVDPLVAQSVVYHAIDYAQALGFKPHPDFPEAIFGPRPAELIATPMARLARPLYIPGPDDDVQKVIAKLTAAVGPEGFDVILPGRGLDLLAESDDEEIEGEGEDEGKDEDEDEDEDVPARQVS